MSGLMNKKKFKIFIASSGSLKEERQALELFFHRQPDYYEAGVLP